MLKDKKGPDFIGVGVQRGGTSWLYECLNEHPDIYMPKKEVHFFDRDYECGVGYYVNLFEAAGENKIAGEYTPDYISSKEAMIRIHNFDPTVKLIIMLREPLERSYSAYRLFQSHGKFLDLEFNEVLEYHPWIFEKSLYSDQIKNIINLFPVENIYIDFYDRIISEPEKVFSDVCRFVGVNPDFSPNSLLSIRNASIYPNLQNRYGLIKIQDKVIRLGLGRQLNFFKNTRIFRYIKKIFIERERDKQRGYVVDDHYLRILRSEVEEIESMLGVNLDAWKSRYIKYRIEK
ncbi:sulfotransferase domain-containing protein [Marinobacter sp. chi1]|uniref:Sulfotransferase domain-containing protein n=1 Tax=Marinobacter suaedae TaxID=3057675 RepID=A0ABT8W2W0_9GAMM|nr:sulfotransferase domain-containing protein [Marinobacter sp. chi1]MDO3722581.1 sulfotransferase domain-containing protein [Marinobacter sp. chi1]